MLKTVKLTGLQIVVLLLIGIVTGKYVPDDMGNVLYWLYLAGLTAAGYLAGKVAKSRDTKKQ